MRVVLYQLPISGPCRSVMMTAEHLGIELEVKNLDLFSGEHMKPEFLAINPQHCVPTINDDGFILWESRAIITYLVNKYAPGNPLYPNDPKARAVVDKMLYFDAGTLHKALRDFYHPQVYGGHAKDHDKEEALKKSLDIFEKILEKTPYAAGDHLTVADYSILSNLIFVEEILDYSFAEFPKVSEWLQRMKRETPKYKEINVVPLNEFKKSLKMKQKAQ